MTVGRRLDGFCAEPQEERKTHTMTVGQRIKLYRKSKNLSQLELSEMIGVAVQTVSKWERDNSMPDISQIVPLAKTLGTTTDAILGMGGNEADEIQEIDRYISKLLEGGYDNQSDDRRKCDINKKYYDRLRSFVDKYPLNYEMMLECSIIGYNVIHGEIIDNLYGFSDKELSRICTDIIRMLNTILGYDSHLGRKRKAKSTLICVWAVMGSIDKAILECEDIDEDERNINLYKISMLANDHESRLKYGKICFENSFKATIRSMYWLTGAHSVIGEPNRDNAIEVWEKFISLIEFSDTVFPKSYNIWHKRFAFIGLGKEYLRRGDFDRVIDCAEFLSDICCEAFSYMSDLSLGIINEKEGLYSLESQAQNPEEIDLQKLKESFIWDFVKLYDECDDAENNPIVTDPRFIAARQRVEAL